MNWKEKFPDDADQQLFKGRLVSFIPIIACNV